MSGRQINLTLGTAGHIDHGKTALIKCLTGCDTDRLKAEKERGMSIELGFAPCLIDELEVGIVDVPGHENFIKTMVAGAAGIDAVIFVVAADDGVMPQTIEHLDIITLLGVEDGIVALTKSDCVSEEALEKVTHEIRAYLSGTFLKDAAVCPLSSITGKGLDLFYDELKKLVSRLRPKSSEGVFRLPVERFFSVKGFGTVVSGIPVCGSVKVGDEVVLLPQHISGRVKAIQVYNRNSDTAMCGQCAALNVTQWDYRQIERGNVVSVGRYFEPAQWVLCKLNMLASAKLKIKNGSEVKLHTGTSEVVCSVYPLQSNFIEAGGQGLVQLRLNHGVVVGPGDRFILRSLSPAHTIGGGIVVEAISHKLKRSHPEVVVDAEVRADSVSNAHDFVEYCVKTTQDDWIDVKSLSQRTKLLPDTVEKIISELVKQGKVKKYAKKYIHIETLGELEEKVIKFIKQFHADNPQSPGIERVKLFELCSLEKGLFDELISHMLADGELSERKNRIALSGHSESFSDEQLRLLEKIETYYQKQLFNPPNSKEIQNLTGIEAGKINLLLQILLEQQRLIKIDKDLFFHCQAVDKARQILIDYIKQHDRLESVEFKYLLDTTRKFAIPLLDYFDSTGLLRRQGNTRYLKITDTK